MIILSQTAPVSQVEAALLMSMVKPVLTLIPFVAYVWVTGSKFDRDARKRQLQPATWAIVFALAPVAALAAVLVIPAFWIGWPASLVILGGTLLAYVLYRNPRVEEEDRYTIGALKVGESIQARKAAAAVRAARIRFLDPQKREQPVPLKEDPLHAVHGAVEALVAAALEARATRLELAPTPQGFVPLQIVDGVRQRREPMPPDVATASIDYLKKMAGLDVNERRKRQNADFWVIDGETLVRTSLNVSGGSSGQSLRLDFDREKQLSKPFDSVGMIEGQRTLLAPLTELSSRHGVVLVAAAPGQGLTTLLYSLLSRHDAFTCSVKSLERQVELRIDGVDQQLYTAANAAVDYASQLQSIVRRGPDIVMVGDLSEPRTAQIIAPAATESVLFYVGLTVNAAPGAEVAAAMRDWFRAVGDLSKGAKPLQAIVTQRLLRKLCEYCRQPHPRAAEILKKIGAPSGTSPTLLAASGKVQVKNRVETCPLCKGTGFLGLIGVHEVVVFDDETRGMLASNDANGAYAAARRKHKSPSLLEAGLARVRDGTTSVEEFQRVLAPPKPAGDAAAGGASAPAAAQKA
ncbi:MAG: hypothetical protein FJ253_00990 [Phycisphaerae bacterium]|nr:hypothetical protein [Phycisphaerae bacterium]